MSEPPGARSTGGCSLSCQFAFYGVLSVPWMVLVGRDGRVVSLDARGVSRIVLRSEARDIDDRVGKAAGLPDHRYRPVT